MKKIILIAVLLFPVVLFSQGKTDTAKVLILCADTSSGPYPSSSVWWQYAYRVTVRKKDYPVEYIYLTESKEPFRRRVVIFKTILL